MLKIENFEVVGWEHAIRGMRNPMNSWEKSDSCTKGDVWCGEFCCGYVDHVDGRKCNREDGLNIGPNDHQLMESLAKGGPVHAKYRRMITVYLDVTAPLYWWKEFDTYKVGTVANSCSTMHKIYAKEFTMDDFSHEHLFDDIDDFNNTMELCDCGYTTALGVLETTIQALNHFRCLYLTAKTKPMKDESLRARNMKRYWWQMIQLLPTSYNQKRTVMLNYEVLHNIYISRRHHKLDEWHVFCDWIEELPYSELITMKSEE